MKMIFFKGRSNKGMNPLAAYLILYHANRRESVEALPEEERKWLIEQVQKSNIKDCLCCPCFAWEYGEDDTINGCICTLGGKVKISEKGQCII